MMCQLFIIYNFWDVDITVMDNLGDKIFVGMCFFLITCLLSKFFEI